MEIGLATDQDLTEIISWFVTETEARKWGGPSIHFPLRLEQLKIDIEWGIADSYAFYKSGNLFGFAQAFDKFGYTHLGRIAIDPKMRGKKLGRQLRSALINTTVVDGVSFSLFVYEDNLPGNKLYNSLGFEVHAYPYGLCQINGCIFMVKNNNKALDVVPKPYQGGTAIHNSKRSV